MLTAALRLAGSAPLVVGVSAHPDDLEIGCGGTLLRLCDQHPDLQVLSVVLTGEGARLDEARAALSAFTGGRGELVALGLRDGHLPSHRTAVKDGLADAVAGRDAALVLAPSASDAHQDHRVAAESAWQQFRGGLLLEYEIVKWEGDLERRNAYVALTPEQVQDKTDLLVEHFASQATRPWFDPEAFRGLLRLRGIECGVRYAEAFTARKLLLSF